VGALAFGSDNAWLHLGLCRDAIEHIGDLREKRIVAFQMLKEHDENGVY